jgi:hypothetical protein
MKKVSKNSQVKILKLQNVFNDDIKSEIEKIPPEKSTMGKIPPEKVENV